METQETSPTTLNLELPAETLRKLKALIILSGDEGNKVHGELQNELQGKFCGYFDQMLTQRIARYLGADLPVELKETSTTVGVDEHGLSDDVDEGSPSLAEQVVKDMTEEAPPENADPFPIRQQFSDVGENSEAFLDAAMQSPKTLQTSQGKASGLHQAGQEARWARRGGGANPSGRFIPQVTIKNTDENESE